MLSQFAETREEILLADASEGLPGTLTPEELRAQQATLSPSELRAQQQTSVAPIGVQSHVFRAKRFSVADAKHGDFAFELAEDLKVVDLPPSSARYSEADIIGRVARDEFNLSMHVAPVVKKVVTKVAAMTADAQTITMGGDTGAKSFKYVEQTQQLEGGIRRIFEDKVTGLLIKKIKKSDGRTPLLIVREKVVTAFVNHFYQNAPTDIGIGLEVLPHDYTMAKYGIVTQKKADGEKFGDYYHKVMASGDATRIAKFKASIVKLRESLVVANKKMAKLMDDEFEGLHQYKGLTAEAYEKVRVETGGNHKLMNDRFAEMGYLADVDSGLMREDVDVSQWLDNCLIKDRMVNGAVVPFLSCFDI